MVEKNQNMSVNGIDGGGMATNDHRMILPLLQCSRPASSPVYERLHRGLRLSLEVRLAVLR